MASSGKKKSKSKGKTLNLNEFLATDDGAAGPGSSYVLAAKPASSNWADAMSDEEIEVGSGGFEYGAPTVNRAALPTAPKASRGPEVDVSKLPDRPPYTAFVGNLSYDCEEGDIMHFFRGLKISTVRLPKDQAGRLKGFGYAEFDDRQSLLDALNLSEEMLKGRKIRVDIAGQQQGEGRDRDNRGGRSGGFDESRGPDPTEQNWRIRDQPSGFNDDRSDDRPRYGGRDSYDRDRGGYGGDRYGDRNSYSDRGYGDRSYGDRGYGDRDRGYGGRGGYGDRGYGGDRYGDRGYGGERDRYGGRDSFERRDGGRRAFGSGFRDGDRDGYGPPRDNYGGDRYGGDRYGGDRHGGDRYGGDRYGPPRDRFGGGSRQDHHEDRNHDSERSDAPRARPKLQLAPRSKPVEPADSATAGGKAASIFGGAKPVDTASKEREIEEKIQHQQEEEHKKFVEGRERREGYRQRRDSDHSDHGDWERRPRERRTSSSSGGKVISPPSSSRRDSERSNPPEVFDDDKPEQSPASLPGTTGKSPPTKKEEVAMRPAPPPAENIWEKRRSQQQSGQQGTPRDEESQKETGSSSGATTAHSGSQPAPQSQPPRENAWSRGKPELKGGEPPRENAWDRRREENRSTEESSDRSHREDPRPRDDRYSEDRRFAGRGGQRSEDRDSEGAGGRGSRGRGGRGGRGRGEGRGRGDRPHRDRHEKPLPKSVEDMPVYKEPSSKDFSDQNVYDLLNDEQ